MKALFHNKEIIYAYTGNKKYDYNWKVLLL